MLLDTCNEFVLINPPVNKNQEHRNIQHRNHEHRNHEDQGIFSV